MDIFYKVIACVAAYLVGSVNFAKIFAKLKHMDITRTGSGNPGTMNVLRSVGKLWGALTFLCDSLKGVAFALIGRYAISGGGYTWLFILGFITVLGHMFPVYSKFKGGKGVATSMGVFITAFPIVGTVVLVILIVFLFLFKYGFIGSLLAVTTMTLYACFNAKTIGNYWVTGCCIAIWALVVFAHRGNIMRLIKGKENKLELTKKKDGGETSSDPSEAGKDDDVPAKSDADDDCKI